MLIIIIGQYDIVYTKNIDITNKNKCHSVILKGCGDNVATISMHGYNWSYLPGPVGRVASFYCLELANYC